MRLDKNTFLIKEIILGGNIINGKETILESEVSIKELLEKEYVEMQEYVTVQVNEDIISTDNYETHIVKDGDTVEFLYYMGGGNN